MRRTTWASAGRNFNNTKHLARQTSTGVYHKGNSLLHKSSVGFWKVNVQDIAPNMQVSSTVHSRNLKYLKVLLYISYCHSLFSDGCFLTLGVEQFWPASANRRDERSSISEMMIWKQGHCCAFSFLKGEAEKCLDQYWVLMPFAAVSESWLELNVMKWGRERL